MNLPNKLGTLQNLLDENGYCGWYALLPAKVSPTSAQLKCIFVNFKERRKAAVEIREAWLQDPEQYKSIVALVCFAIEDCSVPALELAHKLFFYPLSWSESPPIFRSRHH
jgi:hypothetical protein